MFVSCKKRDEVDSIQSFLIQEYKRN